jgi:translation elongation factor EF-G
MVGNEMARQGSSRGWQAEKVQSRMARAVDDRRSLDSRLTDDEIEAWAVANLLKKPMDGKTREEAVAEIMKTFSAFCAARTMELALEGMLSEGVMLDAVMKAVTKHLEPPKKIESKNVHSFEKDLPEELAEALATKRRKYEQPAIVHSEQIRLESPGVRKELLPVGEGVAGS